MAVSLSYDFPTEQLDNWSGNIGKRINQAVGKAMAGQVKPLKLALRQHTEANLQVKKKTFLNNFKVQVLDQDASRLPGLRVSNRLRWMGMHEFGGSISGKMLIPLYGRVGGKRFKAMIQTLMKSGNAYFVKGKNGTAILMAENLKENAATLSGFKKRYRQGAGIKRLKKGTEIPIALLVPRVRLKKRLDMTGVVKKQMPMLVAAIAANLAR